MRALLRFSVRQSLTLLIASSTSTALVAQSDADPVPAEVVVDANSEQGVDPGAGPKHALLVWNGGRLNAARELWLSEGDSTSTRRFRANDVPLVDPRRFANSQSAATDPVFLVAELQGVTNLWMVEPGTAPELIQVLDGGGLAITFASDSMAVDHDGTDSAAYFAATDGSGTELWRAVKQTQGTTTAVAAAPLQNLWPDSMTTTNSSDPDGFVTSARKLFFAATADDGAGSSRDLWVLDLDDPTVTPDRITVGGPGPEEMLAASDRGVFFVALQGGARRVFFCDGATRTEVTSSIAYADPENLVWLSHPSAGQERLFFVATNAAGDRGLWRVDPDQSPPSAGEVTSGDVAPRLPTAFRNRVFFVSAGQLWTVKSSGTARKFWDLDEIDAIEQIFANETALFMVQTRGTASDPKSGLWCVSRGMSLLAELDGVISNMVSARDRLYFQQTIDGREELWVSQATARSTHPVLDSQDSNPSGFAVLGDKVLFAATGTTPSGQHEGRELWVLTRDGGRRLINIHGPDAAPPPQPSVVRSSDPEQLTRSGDFVYFVATHAVHGRELWGTDGDGATTMLVKDIRPGIWSSDVHGLTPFADGPYFVANDGAGAKLWKVTESASPPVSFDASEVTYDGHELEAPEGLTVLTHATGTYLFCTAVTGEGSERYRRAFVTNGTKIATLGFGARTTVDCSFVMLEDPVEDSVVFAADQGRRGIEPCRVLFADIDARLN